MRTIPILLILLLAATTAGCMTNTRSSDGARTFTFDCSGRGSGWDDCNKQAAAQCGDNNFNIISQIGSADGQAPSGNSEMKRTLVVSCK